MSKTQQGFSTRELKKIFSIVVVAYIVLAVAFYFLAGEQLRYRDSRGNIEMPDRKSTRLNSSHRSQSRMPSSA